MKRILLLLLIPFFSALVFVGGFIVSVKVGVFGALPTEEEVAQIENEEASLIYSSDNEIIGKFYHENRSNVKHEDVPLHIFNALVATEDSRFFEHEGIDFISLLRVLVKSILLGDSHAGGGSTISQQLAKNIYGRKHYAFFSMPINKIKEMTIASRLESVYSKEEIITLYLNTVSFGENIYGIENASRRYFSKPVADLTIDEGAVLIGILKANTFYNPRLNPENSLRRRNVVMHQMLKYGYLEEDQYKEFSALELNLNYLGADELQGKAPYFLDYIKSDVKALLAEYNQSSDTVLDLYTDGLIIETTLNYQLQKSAQQSVYKHLKKLQIQLNRQIEKYRFWEKNKSFLTDKIKKSDGYLQLIKAGMPEKEALLEVSKERKKMILPSYNGEEVLDSVSIVDSIKHSLSRLQAGVFSVDPQSGKILAWIGGTDYKYFPYNRVLSERQVGSTFKPFVYLTALEKGITPCTFYPNERKVYEEFDGWSPGNSDGNYEGFYSMKGGLTKSVNTITAQLIFDVGVQKTIETVHRLGIEKELPEVPSIALGTANISLFEMIKAYSAIANSGFQMPIYGLERIKTKSGKVIWEKEESVPSRVIAKKHAETLNNMLESVVDSGTARRLRYKYEFKEKISGKTGTTQNNTDGWFIGYTGNVLTGVWVGVDQPIIHFKDTRTGQGANTALPIWAGYYQSIKKDKDLQNVYLKQNDTPSSINLTDCPLYRDEKPNLIDRLFKKQKVRKSTAEEKSVKGRFKRFFKRK